MLMEMNQSKQSLLLHVCCAPCATHSIRMLTHQFDVTAYFYNPNIEPEDEYKIRLEEMNRLAGEWNVPLLEDPYENSAWHEAVDAYKDEPEGGRRCELCYRFRLRKTALTAKARQFDRFTTTLSISPHKSAGLINRAGSRVAEETGLPFHAVDLKKKDGFRISCQISKEMHFYRQSYCGCLYSRRKT